MLCLRLGEEPHLDFFKPALAQFTGFVRNAMPVAGAKRALERMLPKSTNKNLQQAINWMPSDVQEETLRLAAEFATLKPFVVHAWQDSTGIAATYAARMIGVPRVMISTRNVRPTNFAWYRPYMYHAHGEIARCSDVVMINNSEAGATDYAQWLDIPSGRFVVKRNGLDTTTIHRPSPSTLRICAPDLVFLRTPRWLVQYSDSMTKEAVALGCGCGGSRQTSTRKPLREFLATDRC
jgi:hypothetical protein